MKTKSFRLLSISLIFLFFNFTLLYGQSFSHSVGASLYIITDTDFDYVSAGPSIVPAATYSPRFNFYESRGDFSVSVGTHLGVGFEFNSRAGGYFILDAPLVIEANFGHAAHPDSDSNFGGFIGGGFSYTNLSGSSVYGPMANAGLRFILRDRPITLRGSYLIAPLGDNSSITNMVSLGLFYNLGRY